ATLYIWVDANFSADARPSFCMAFWLADSRCPIILPNFPTCSAALSEGCFSRWPLGSLYREVFPVTRPFAPTRLARGNHRIVRLIADTPPPLNATGPLHQTQHHCRFPKASQANSSA